jgi:hypothetical protein
MTGSADHRPTPGKILSKISRLLFNARLQSTVVEPTLADMQREVAQAGRSRVGRWRALWRGYRAFWMVVLAAPFATWARRQNADAGLFPDTTTAVAIASIALMLSRIPGLAIGAWLTFIVAATALVAILIHRWYARHPSRIPTPAAPLMWSPSPQINFSSMDVAGDIGGLIFVVGSVLIVVVGLPAVIVFLFAGTAAGCVVAWGLARWHTRHPTSASWSPRLTDAAHRS